MSVIIKERSTGIYKLFIKGADNIISKRLNQFVNIKNIEKNKEHL